MVTLFTRPGCAYCAKVLARVGERGVSMYASDGIIAYLEERKT